MGEFHFLRPAWLVLLLPMLLVAYGLWRRQDHTADWRQVIDKHLLPHLIVGADAGRRIRPVQVLALLWLLGAIALAGPAWRQEASPFADDQAGLIILLEVSESMLASDVQPSRLERAKHKISDLLDRRAGAATGLIVYSGSAHLVMPLTRDDRIISTMIEDLTPELMPEEGDALLDALQLAEALLQRNATPGSVLAITDSVAAHQAAALETADIALQVQFLLLRSPAIPVDSALASAASSLNASINSVTVDASDVEEIARRATAAIRSVPDANKENRWQDAGYVLLPLLALLALAWSRKGWQLR